ncbi:branched-chain amino acid ABC transporter permease [Leptolyngbya sp. FACHB-261]|uniref:branched-chain amino acid ABC transporter permease n=1 Tax=Leptolyngbya sp. FACHB-261 TaxID=2692806 RepID=UPI001685FDEC|nr:branched-chain amino acid ABC transporter permease [Leptolyngbya sp. FACHB-261]MBD2104494.1 branched-chain amino acid ABC transporter permease [Leptolyngbya sp. FACHB-261]
MDDLPQQLINGLWRGSALALFAMGYTLVFGVLDVLNLAHGATYMIGAFAGWVVVTRLGWPLYLALPVAMVAAGLLAGLLDRLAFKPLRALTTGSLILWLGFVVLLVGLIAGFTDPLRLSVVGLGAAVMIAGLVQDGRAVRPLRQRAVPPLAPMITSIGASTILVSLVRSATNAQQQRFPLDPVASRAYAVLPNVVLTPVQIGVFGVALSLMLALVLLINRTNLGRAIRAIAFNERTARLLGINVDWVVSQTFFLSGALAGAAGVLLGLAFNNLRYDMGNQIELAGLTVIIVGGMGSIGGAALAAFLIGLIQVLSAAYIDSSFRDAITFALLLLMLLVRPSGLFGRGTASRS